MKIAMLFPGYSSQAVGMGKEFYDEFRIVLCRCSSVVEHFHGKEGVSGSNPDDGSRGKS